MRWLGDQGCNTILVEAGSTLSGALLTQGLVDELVLYMAPKMLGAEGRPLAAIYPSLLKEVPQWRYEEVTTMGDDLRIIAQPL